MVEYVTNNSILKPSVISILFSAILLIKALEIILYLKSNTNIYYFYIISY
jgi:hypothetical protein